MTATDLPIPPSTVAALAPLGATFFVNGLILVIPDAASAADIFAAMDLLDRVGQERYVSATPHKA